MHESAVGNSFNRSALAFIHETFDLRMHSNQYNKRKQHKKRQLLFCHSCLLAQVWCPIKSLVVLFNTCPLDSCPLIPGFVHGPLQSMFSKLHHKESAVDKSRKKWHSEDYMGIDLLSNPQHAPNAHGDPAYRRMSIPCF